MAAPYKILVVAPSWVGDMVMSQTLLKIIKEQYAGNCQIDVLVNGWARDVVQRMPEVSEVHCNPFQHGELALIRRWQLGRKLARHNYQQAFILPNSWKSAFIPWVAAIPRRTGFIGEMRYGLINDYYRLDKVALPLMIERFAALANNGRQRTDLPYPSFSTNSSLQQQVLSKLGLTQQQPIICLCPAAEYGPAKRWPTSRFAQLADLLQERGYQVWIMGSAKDNGLGHEIMQAAQHKHSLFNLCGKTSLVEVIDLLALATVVVSNDSGLMHVACAVNVPVVAIYGSSSPGFTPPLSAHAIIIKREMECSPCFARTCKFGHYACLTELSPVQILAAMHQHLT